MARKPLPAGGVLSDRIHFVHVYTVEAHPKQPDPSPYSGGIWELNYSSIGQMYTYEDRQAAARIIRPLIQGRQFLLVDTLDPGNEVNTVWCTYGPVPNAAYLIRQDGVIEVAQEWCNPDGIEKAAMALVEEPQ